jgi:hypothetical protein
LIACEGGLFAPGDVNPPIWTSAEEYVLETTSIGWEAQIPFVYENRSDGSYFLVNCNGAYDYHLEKWLNDRWVLAYTPVLPACLSPVIGIPSRSTFSGSVPIFAGYPGSNFYPKFELSDPQGIYRLVLHPLSSFDQNAYPFGPEIPLEDRISNEFRLVTAADPP